MAKGKGKKKPKVVAEPPGAKRPLVGEQTPDVLTRQPLTWGLKRVDLGGTWSCRNLMDDELPELLRQLSALEGENLSALTRDKKVKEIPASDVRPPAQARLREIRLEEHDTLWELRLPRKQRVWGLVSGSVFEFVWWDPDETVCGPPPKGARRR